MWNLFLNNSQVLTQRRYAKINIYVKNVITGVSNTLLFVVIAHSCTFYSVSIMCLVRISYFGIYTSLAGVVQGLIGASLIDALSLELFCIVGEGFAVSTLIYALLRMDKGTPQQLIANQTQKQIGNTAHNNKNKQKNICE